MSRMDREHQKPQQKSVDYTSIRRGSKDSTTHASIGKRKHVSEYVGSPAETNLKGHQSRGGLLSKISQQFTDALSYHPNPRRISLFDKPSPQNPSIKATVNQRDTYKSLLNLEKTDTTMIMIVDDDPKMKKYLSLERRVTRNERHTS